MDKMGRSCGKPFEQEVDQMESGKGANSKKTTNGMVLNWKKLRRKWTAKKVAKKSEICGHS